VSPADFDHRAHVRADGQYHAHERTKVQELHSDEQGHRRRTKAYEEGGAAADFDPW
jgi:hypothetical protein